jgi:hypothetical protein
MTYHRREPTRKGRLLHGHHPCRPHQAIPDASVHPRVRRSRVHSVPRHDAIQPMPTFWPSSCTLQSCHEPPGAFSSCQPAGQHGPISFFGPLLPRPCLCLGHLHLGLGLRPRCWYILVLVYTPAYSIATDHSPDCYSPEPRPTGLPSDNPSRPRASSPSRSTLDGTPVVGRRI